MTKLYERPKNAWRSETPGVEGWTRTARPDDPNKYLMVSSDNHASEPFDFLDAIEPEFRPRLPRLETDENGSQWLISEGSTPLLIKRAPKAPTEQKRENFEKPEHDQHQGNRMEEEDVIRAKRGTSIPQRLEDQDRDGVDAEIVYPNRGLLCFSTPDPVFADAMCRAFNRWAVDYFEGHRDRSVPVALVATGKVELAMSEVAWAAESGYSTVSLPCKPLWGPTVSGELQYNDPSFNPMWALIQDADLTITFHVSTGRDPRASGGNGGAIINFVSHAVTTTIEPLSQVIASGVLERYPDLRVVSVESGIGWLPWFLESMDYAYRAHHFWVRPVIPEPPSFYFRRNCAASFQEDHAGLEQVEAHGLVDNVLWANDYPHHEGSWPHSAAAIERSMAHLSDESRAKILGLNAARIFKMPVPAHRGG